MPETAGAYHVVISAGVEHLYPVGDDDHDPSRSCPCGPLDAIGQGPREEPIVFHRTRVQPL